MRSARLCPFLLLILVSTALAVPHPSDGATAAPRSSSEDVPVGVIQAAHDGLQKFLDLIPRGELQDFGFANESEISRAALEKPFAVYTILVSSILGYSDTSSIEGMVYSTGAWLFPIVCDGTARTLLTVDRVHDQWRAVDIGGLSPADKMPELARLYPSSDGYDRKYVRIFQTGSQFVLVTKDGISNLVPLEQTARQLGLIEATQTFQYQRVETSDIMRALRPALLKSLERIQH